MLLSHAHKYVESVAEGQDSWHQKLSAYCLLSFCNLIAIDQSDLSTVLLHAGKVSKPIYKPPATVIFAFYQPFLCVCVCIWIHTQ